MTTADQGVPRAFRTSLYLLILIAAVASLPFVGRFSPIPTTYLLDAWIILFVAYCVFRGRTLMWPTFLLLLGYLLTRLVGFLAIGAPLEDFLQAYRWVLYLVTFSLAVGRSWAPTAPLVRFTWALLSLALLKAGLTFAVLGPGERPGLLLENNFELALFSGLAAVVYQHVERHRLLLVAMVGLLTVLAGSRSGAVVFVIFFVYAVVQMKKLNLFFRYILVCAIPAAGFVAFSIFAERAAHSTQVDRLNFLSVFLAETSNWNVLGWIFGTIPITPLSSAACAQLSYYQSLFSSEGDGSCYSVILHAFILRVVFDAGLLGLAIAVVVTWMTMRKSRVKLGLAAALLLIAFANGASVSGLNNPYVALPIILAIVTARALPTQGQAESTLVLADAPAPPAPVPPFRVPTRNA